MSNRLPVLAAEIRAAHAGVEDAVKTAAERAVGAGHALLEAKSLVKHGGWMPWLKEHCRLSERTAQLYMKIAKLGLETETVAVLGIKAASQAIRVAYPDPFAEKTEADKREFALYVLMAMGDGMSSESAEAHIMWLARNGWKSPSEWLSETGDRYREFFNMRQPSEKFRNAWCAFQREHPDKTLPDIEEAMLAEGRGHG